MGGSLMTKDKTKWRVATGLDCWELIRTKRGAIEVYPKKFPSRTMAEEVGKVLNGQKTK